MKSSSFKLGITFLAMGLIIGSEWGWGRPEARAADWREFTEATTGIFYYDAESLTFPSEGWVRVWIHNVNKHETDHVEFDCRNRNYRVLDVVEYDEHSRIKARHDYYDNPSWLSISPKSVSEPLRQIICR